MKSLFDRKIVGYILICALSVLLIYHLLVIFNVLPRDMVWGGQEDLKDIVVYLEVFAVALTAFFMLMGAARAGIILNRSLQKIASVVIWIMVVFFFLNIFGNLTAKTLAETLIMTPLSIIMFICSLILGIKGRKKKDAG